MRVKAPYTTNILNRQKRGERLTISFQGRDNEGSRRDRGKPPQIRISIRFRQSWSAVKDRCAEDSGADLDRQKSGHNLRLCITTKNGHATLSGLWQQSVSESSRELLLTRTATRNPTVMTKQPAPHFASNMLDSRAGESPYVDSVTAVTAFGLCHLTINRWVAGQAEMPTHDNCLPPWETATCF